MKALRHSALTLLLAVGLALAPALIPVATFTSPAQAKVKKVLIVKTGTGAATQIETTGLIYSRIITFQAGSANAAVFYVGSSAVTSTNYFAVLSASQGYTVTPSVFLADQGEEFQLSDFYVLGTASDKIYITYETLTSP